jgi:2'-5' RNA ligase
VNVLDYDWFAVVAFAPKTVREEVEGIRAVWQSPPRPMIPAHVTLRGTFDQVADLAAVLDAIRACASKRPTGEIRANKRHVWRRDDRSTIVLLAEVEPAVESLHWDLLDAMRGLCAPASSYRDEETSPYHPHLTLVQNIDSSDEELALAAIERLGPAYTFTASDACVMGRRGGRSWETLATFPIGERGQ